jgi:hypothetical protein
MMNTRAEENAMRRIPLLIALVAGLAVPALATGNGTGPAGIKAAGETVLTVANLDEAQAATVVVDFFKQGGGAPVSVGLPAIHPQRSWDVDLALENRLTNGAYAALVSSDQAVAGLARLSWPASGGALAYESPGAGTEILVGDVRKTVDRGSLVTVQNNDPNQQATVTVAVHLSTSGGGPAVMTKNHTVDKGNSITLDFANHPDYDLLPQGGDYWLRITSATSIAATAFLDYSDRERSVTGSNGVPADQLTRAWQLPAVPVGWGPAQLDSEIYLLNPGNNALTAKVAFVGIDGACADQALGVDAQVQPGVGARLPVRTLLPADCLAAATVVADAALLVQASLEGSGAQVAAAYNAIPSAQAGLRLVVPHWQKQTDPGSTLVVQNTGLEPTTVTVDWSPRDKPAVSGCPACSATLPPGGGHRFAVADVAELAGGDAGAATLRAGQPLAVTVLDTRINSDLTAYGVGTVVAAGSFGRQLLPIVTKARRSAPTPATPTPSPTIPVATPTPGVPFKVPGASAMVLANLGTAEARGAVRLTRADATTGLSLTLPAIAPGGYGSIYLPVQADLPDGAYSARAAIEGALSGLLASTSWPAAGAATMYNAPEAATDVIVQVLRWSAAGERSILTIQSTDARRPVAVTVALGVDGSPEPIRRHTVPIGPGSSTSIDLADEPGDPLPAGATGWARVTAPVPVAVIATHALPDPASVYTTLGVPAERAARDWILPFTPAGFPLARNDALVLTGQIAVFNPGTAGTAVSVTYHPVAAALGTFACPTGPYADPANPRPLPAGAMLALRPAELDPLRRCPVMAEIHATGPVLAEARLGQSLFGLDAYSGLAPDQGALRLQLPVVRRSHTAGQFSTAIVVVNPGDEAARVALEVTLADGSTMRCPGCDVVLPPHTGQLWWPPGISAWPPNRFGQATLTSDRPVMALVADLSEQGSTDPSVYRGLAAALDAPNPHLPLLLKNAPGGGPPNRPTPEPTATATSTATPVPTAAPAPGVYLPWSSTSAP